MPDRSRSAHLWPLDVVRLLTFFAVISVHVIAFTEPPGSATAGGAMMLLQFGREVFFTLSGFVLVWATLNRPVRVMPFWRRRLPAVAVPYLVWTLIYAFVSTLMPPYPRFTWSGLGMDVINGNAYYHLYFLLVTLQLYIVFPWLVRAVRRSAHHAGWVLGAVGAANLAWLGAIQYVPAPPGPARWLWEHAYELLPTYAVYVLAGAYAACHLERVEAVVRRHPRRLLAVAAAGVVVALGAYAAQLGSMAPRIANAVLQPAMAASCVAAIVLVMLMGWRWADGRRRGQAQVAWGSRISFGVYLSHPLILAALLNIGLGNGHQIMPAPLATAMVLVGTIGGAVVLTTLLQRTRLAFSLTGRAQHRDRRISSDAHLASIPLSRPSDRPAPVPIAELLQHRSRVSPDRPAFIEGASGRVLTWSQVWDAARPWADVPSFADRRVGLRISDPLEMVTCYLGALAAGVCVAPLDPNGTPAELAANRERLGLSAVVTDHPDSVIRLADRGVDGADLWATQHGQLRLVSAAAAGRAPGGSGPGRAAGNGAALILSSSGTTGDPKIVPLIAGQLRHTAQSVIAAHHLGAADCGYSPLPLFHINGLVVGVLTTVLTGGRLVLDRRFSASTFWATVEAQQVTWLNLVPGIISVLGQVTPPEAGQAGTVRFVRSASAPLPLAALLRFEDHCALPVVETYGMTEAASQIAANPLYARRPGSVGRPVGVDLRVVDRRRLPVAAGVVGEVEIRGASVVERYWRAASSEPATDPDGWLSTGDLGSLDEDRYLYLLGRVDDVINRGGEKVHPREIEEVLLQDPDVGAAVVIGRPHPVVGEEPIAVVVMARGGDEHQMTARLRQRCDRELSRYKRPAAITVATELPAGATGKVRRRELRQTALDVA